MCIGNYHLVSAKKRRSVLNAVSTYLALVAGGVLLILPFFWMVSTSLKTVAEVNRWPIVWMPADLIWGNYAVFP